MQEEREMPMYEVCLGSSLCIPIDTRTVQSSAVKNDSERRVSDNIGATGSSLRRGMSSGKKNGGTTISIQSQ